MEATKAESALVTVDLLEKASNSTPSQRASSSPGTLLLVFVNVAVFLALPLVARDYPRDPIQMGALVRQEVFSGEWWRLITAGFVHIYLSHLIPNMAGLWILGKRLERLVGSFGVIAFYVGCEVVGNLAILHLHPSSGGYGSSLPITGFAGTLLLVYGVRFSTLSKRAKWKFGLLLLMAAGLVRSDIFDTHFFAHTIGLLIGAAFAVILLLCTRRRSETVADRCVPLP